MTPEQIIQIIQLVSVLEPPVVAAVMALLQKLQGKSTDEILGEADSIWDGVRAAALKELGK
jgi:hypothetical protein